MAKNAFSSHQICFRKQGRISGPQREKDMLEKITWIEYLTTTAITTGGYYLLVGGLYYRKELKELVQPGRIKFTKAPTLADTAYVSQELDEDEEDEAFELLNLVVDDVRGVMKEAGQEVGKEALLMLLQTTLTNYEGLPRSAYHDTLNDIIIEQSKELCGVVLSAAELEEVWNALPR